MAMSEEETKRIVEMTVRETVPHVVKETLTSYGIDANNPIEVQKDNAFLHKIRTRLESTSTKVWGMIILCLVGLMFNAFGTGLIELAKSWIA